jgi:membrane-associated phospholipid phosphatase
MAAPSAVLFWNGVALQRNVDDHTLDILLRGAPGPTASAYMLAVVHIAMGDACAGVPGSGYGPLRVSASPPAGADRRVWIGGAAFGALTFIYRDTPQAQRLEAARTAFFAALGLPSSAPGWTAGVKLGQKVARRLWNREKIANAIGRDNYIPKPGQHNVDPDDPCQGFYGVRWGIDIPLIVPQSSAGTPPPPPALGDPLYAAAWREVFEDGNRFRVLDYTRQIAVDSPEEIALFWAYDGARRIGTPPRLYNQHVVHIAKKDGLLDDGNHDLRWGQLLGRCNVALADAARVCWRAKYRHAVWRPIRGIRNVDGVTLPAALLPDAGWDPYGAPRTNRPVSPPEVPQSTPNFPAYPSGHATFGGACFGALRLWRRANRLGGSQGNNLTDVKLGSDELNDQLVPPTTDHVRPDLPRPLRERSFATIGAIIKENGQSRIFHGVHWQFDSVRGIESGEKIALAVHDNAYV